MKLHSLLTLLISLLPSCPDYFSYPYPPSSCFLFLSVLRVLGCPVLSCCVLVSLPLGHTPAKLMNGYMVLTNGGSQPRSSPSLSSRTFSRSAGDIISNMDGEPPIRKMETVVKLDAVRFSFSFYRVRYWLVISVIYVCLYVNSASSSTALRPVLLPASAHVPFLPASSIVCINPCVVLCNAPHRRCLTLL